jgi:hypothetical protein
MDYQNIANQNEPDNNMRYMEVGPNRKNQTRQEGPGGYFRARRIYSRITEQKIRLALSMKYAE